MHSRSPLTLGRALFLTLLGIGLTGGALVTLLLQGWRRSLIEGSERLRDAAASRVEAVVQEFLDGEEKVLTDAEEGIRAGTIRPDDRASLERGLFEQVLSHPQLAEVALTRAERLGYDEYLHARLAETGRWQVSVFRLPESEGNRILTRHTHREGARFVSELRSRPPEKPGLLEAPFARQAGDVDDPTDHLTFQTTASAPHQGSPIWSDLHFAELDSHLPEPERRVVVTVMKAIEDGSGRFLGVLRVGSRADQLDEEVRKIRVNEADPHDPHRIFLCDEQGRLLTRLSEKDRLQDMEGDLRIVPERLPAEIALALRHPTLQQVGPEEKIRQSGRFDSAGRSFLVTFLGLGRTQGWRVGIVVPEDYYLGDLQRARRSFLTGAFAVAAIVFVVVGISLRTVRRGLRQIVASTSRMRNFEFSPSEVRSPFRDVHVVMDGLELAKTAMRAMSRYVPVDLVRHLYQSGREPVLGGQLVEVSLMFTDIQDFTRFAERLSPDELAQALGRYLEVMTAAIHATDGVIDKYIGDAIMALWNAPRACPDHAQRACRAALACREASRRLHASPDWEGRPLFHTRFGLHRDEVLVGHFGAPDRMSYTALGDGVNLASRLEALNKQYGTAILASETIREQAGDAFAFRLVDVVAVKGKTKGIGVYELLGEAGQADERIDVARSYERALEAYFRRRFDEALALFEAQSEDGPSRVLAERCRRMRENPPPSDWDGIYVATAK